MSFRARTPYSHRRPRGCERIRFADRRAAAAATRRYGGQPVYCPACVGYHVDPTDPTDTSNDTR